MTKIYIHHYYTEHLFYFLAHNTENREFNIVNNIGSVKCKYKNADFEFVFKPELSDESDGYHLMDWTTTHSQIDIDEKLKDFFYSKRYVEGEIDNHQNNALYNLTELLKDKSNWILTFFCGEKSLYKHESLVYHKNIELFYDMENSLYKLNNFKIIFEEVFLQKEVETKYPNFYYAFSNTMWYWNNHAEMRWYYEFKEIYDKLNFEYDLVYSMRAYKYNRILLLNELKKINNKKIFLQRTDARSDSELYIKYKDKVSDIYLNSVTGITDFDNLNLVNKQRVGLDLFFRLLTKAKMHILDESWAWSKNNFSSNYISEKTIGYILAGIPFISTHSYPLEIVQKLLNVTPHPFLEESKKFKGDAKLFSNFVKEFMENFDENYKKCKEWVDMCHNSFMNKMNGQNSLLDLILNDFKKESKKMSLL